MRATEPINFKLIADNCFKKAGGNILDATRAMEKIVKSDTALFRALMEPLVSEACSSILRSIGRARNQEVWIASEKGRGPARRAMVGVLATGLLGWVTLGGKMLGDCTRDELLPVIKHYEGQGNDMLKKARWLKLVYKSVPDGVLIKDVMTDKKLQQLQKKAA